MMEVENPLVAPQLKGKNGDRRKDPSVSADAAEDRCFKH